MSSSTTAREISNPESAPLVTAAELRAAGRVLVCPFRIGMDNGTELFFIRPLRVLPGKRIVGEGMQGDERVLTKLFIARESRRHWERERVGIVALTEAGLPTPRLLAAGRLAGGGHYLLTHFLEDAGTLDTSEETMQNWLGPAIRLVGQLHSRSLIQTDLHLRNFLRLGNQLFLIDGDGVQTCRDGDSVNAAAVRSNLALFLAQLPINQEGRHAELIEAYRQANPNVHFHIATLAADISRTRNRRLREYLDKCLRDCSHFKVERHLSTFTAVVRAQANRLAPLLANPDAWVTRAAPLKAGNTSTVVRLDIDGHPIIVKRYNIKGLTHAASRFWRPSRAWHSWREGHRLAMLGIPAPAPLALIENRLGPLRGKAWLVMEYMEGPNLLQHWPANAHPPDAELRALLRTFQGLTAARITHGDLKATNLIWHKGDVALIDLDAMKQHRTSTAFEHAWRRDMQRFLENWPANSVLRSNLESRLAISQCELEGFCQR